MAEIRLLAVPYEVGALRMGRPVRAISLTAYDPEVDADGRVPPIAMRLLEVVAERIARKS